MILRNAILLSGTCAAGCFAAAKQEQRPNIVFIISDDQVANTIGCYGGNIPTPNIDRLAAEGMKFTRAYTTAAVCMPTRYTALTGEYPSRSVSLAREDGMVRLINYVYMTPEQKTAGNILQDAGYRTGFVGKWHNFKTNDPESCPHRLPADADPANPDIALKLMQNQQAVCKETQSHGFEFAGSIYDGNLHEYPKKLQVHNTEYITKAAVDFLDSADERPFFLWMATTLIHAPAVDFQKDDIRMTPEGIRTDLEGIMPARKSVVQRAGAAAGSRAAAVSLDDAVGVILKKLDEKKLTGNTLIMFMSDQQNTGKTTVFENGINVPLLARWPAKIKAGSVCEELVDNTDFLPTWAALARAQVSGMTVDGHDISPMFNGNFKPVRDAVFAEAGYAKSVTTKNWKYIAIRYPESLIKRGFVPPQSGTVDELMKQGVFDLLKPNKTPYLSGHNVQPWTVAPDQLYDLRKDPKEKTNLAGNPDYQNHLIPMKKLLSRFIQETGQQFGEFAEINIAD